MIRSSTWFWVGLAWVYLSLAPHILRLSDAPHGDVGVYFNAVETLYSGKVPYHLERSFEYPPYALIWFLIPSIGSSVESFRLFLALQLLLFDFLFKWWLLNEGLRRSYGLVALVPLVAYSIGTGFLSTLYLQRLDLVPALLAFASIHLLALKKPFCSGVLLGLGAGTKLFPVLLAPLLFALSGNRRHRRALVAGTVVALFPIALMSPWVDWWRFLEFHDRRGFEVESIYAVAFWLLNFFVDLDLRWSFVTQWLEVTGPNIVWLVPYAKGICLFSTIATIAWISRVAWLKRKGELDLPESCSMALVVILPFVAFNIVLSPQYMIWLLVIAVVGLLGFGRSANVAEYGKKRVGAIILVVIASMLTPIWFPSPEFRSGFTLGQTSVLLARNCMLITSWILLVIHYGGRSVPVWPGKVMFSKSEKLFKYP